MIVAKAYCPGHITGFFEIYDQPEDILRKGSRGAGVSIEKGIITTVSLKPAKQTLIKVSINGIESEAPVTRKVVEQVLKLVNEKFVVMVDHEVEIPIGAGIGASGAGAFSTALALNKALNLGLTYDKVAQIAHIAEIVNKTGLGTVLAQSRGGVEIRVKPGAPGIGHVDLIPVDPDTVVVCGSLGPIETKKMLSNPEIREKINRIGGRMVDELVKNASIEKLMKLSKRFAAETGLMSEKVKNAVKELEKNGFVNASMAMFGETVFCFVEREKANQVLNILKKYFDKGVILISDINFTGARILGGNI
ncbi:MAG: GHMP kinase [Candidatus Odinarchaeota archaeon]|nr:GHMP kinase [Candidatus Odinarchaeota archaeon]